MEIYSLEITFPNGDKDDPWSRVVEVKENMTLEELHLYIQEVVKFENDHLYEFYIAKNPKKRSEPISQQTKLNEIYPLTGEKLYYLFDFGDEWLFQLKKSKKRITMQSNVEYPKVTESKGNNPEQYSYCEE